MSDVAEQAAQIIPPPKLINVEGAPRARPISVPAARITHRPKCPKVQPGAWPESVVTLMASWMDRHTTSLIQMGGEGVNWVARSKFNGNANTCSRISGEGTYYHSAASLAVRQAIASGEHEYHLQDPI